MNNLLLNVMAFFGVVTALSPAAQGTDDQTKAVENAASSTPRDYAISPDLEKVSPDQIESAYKGRTIPESIRMYLAGSDRHRVDSGGTVSPSDMAWLVTKESARINSKVPLNGFSVWTGITMERSCQKIWIGPIRTRGFSRHT
jgi:hypothetical protein